MGLIGFLAHEKVETAHFEQQLALDGIGRADDKLADHRLGVFERLLQRGQANVKGGIGGARRHKRRHDAARGVNGLLQFAQLLEKKEKKREKRARE